MKKNILIITLLLLASLNIFSQSDFKPGYVYLNDHDSIYGLINNRNDIANHRVCVFRKSENDSIQKFYPDKISGYYFIEGKHYISKTIELSKDSETIFVEYLIKGTVSLFFYRDPIGGHYLIQKVGLPLKEISYNDAIIEVNGEQFYRDYMINTGLIRYYLNDCPELYPEMDKIKNPSHAQLMKLIKDYHDIKCPNDVCIIYKKKLPEFTLFLQPQLGITGISSELTLDENNETCITSQIGLLAYLWLPLTNERLYFKSGILYSNAKTMVEQDSENGAITQIYENINYFKIPIQLQYIFSKHELSPTVGVGLNAWLSPVDPFSFIPALNAGLNFKVSNAIHLSLNYDLDYAGKLFFIPDKTTFIVSNSLSLGLKIKL
jgi:hypothetical protein